MTITLTSRSEATVSTEAGKLYKICIAQANSGVESEQFWIDNHYYEENQQRYPGLTKFSNALIAHTITKTEKARWAIEHAIPYPPRFREDVKHWVRRLDDDETWVIYDIYVNLSEKDFLFWKLKYE